MKKKSKPLNLLNIALILTVAIAVVAVVFAYKVFFGNNEKSAVSNSGFNPKREAEASAIYKRITSYNLDTSYPSTAEEVLRLYNDTSYLLYGNMIEDQELVMEVLEYQRKLCSEELIGETSFDEQFKNLQTSLSVLGERNVVCLSIEEISLKYDMYDKNICIASVKTVFTNTSVYRNYILQKNEISNRWEILIWEKTDENFNPVA